MGAPIILYTAAIDLFRSRPTLWSAQRNHGPPGPFTDATSLCILLDAMDLPSNGIESAGHAFVHFIGLMPLNEIGRVAIAAKKIVELLMADPRENRGLAILYPLRCRIGRTTPSVAR